MRLFFIYCFCTCALASTVLAQPQRVDRTRPASEEEQLDDNANSRYLLALGYLRGMQFDRAIAVLRELHVEYPEHKTIYDTLKEAYISTKQYGEAILLLDDAIVRSEEIQKLPLSVERAQLLYLSGDEPAALDSWYSTVESALERETAYRIAYNSMVEVRLLVQAIDLLKQGRQVVQNKNLFHAELAYLYSLTGQHEFATQEYLDLLALNPRQLNYVRGRLGRDMQQEGALEVVIRVTQERVLAQPDLLQLRDLLAWLYEESGDFERAYREITAMEEDESSSQEIYQFALRAAEAGAFTVAGNAFQAVLETHPEEDLFVKARLGIADMYRLQAERADKSPEDYQRSLEAYERFLMDFPGHPQAPMVMAQIAALHQDVFRNRDTARVILQRLATQYMNSSIGQQAQFDLGRLAIEEGDLDQAATIFAHLSAQTSDELFVRSKFEEAMIHFYVGEFTDAQSKLGDIRDETDKETANDAIALRVLLLESPQPDSTNQALLSYAQALLFLRQQKANETVLVTQDILTQWGAHPIADEARFLRAEALLLNGQSEDALIAFGEFPLIHPESPLRDRSLFHYAEILETIQGDTAGALQAYTDLLIQYPGSLLVEKVRERIRALRATNL